MTRLLQKLPDVEIDQRSPNKPKTASEAARFNPLTLQRTWLTARPAYARILESRTCGDVKFFISHVADDITLLNIAAEFAGRPPVQKTHLTVDVIKNIAPRHIRDLLG